MQTLARIDRENKKEYQDHREEKIKPKTLLLGKIKSRQKHTRKRIGKMKKKDIEEEEKRKKYIKKEKREMKESRPKRRPPMASR